MLRRGASLRRAFVAILAKTNAATGQCFSAAKNRVARRACSQGRVGNDYRYGALSPEPGSIPYHECMEMIFDANDELLRRRSARIAAKEEQQRQEDLKRAREAETHGEAAKKRRAERVERFWAEREGLPQRFRMNTAGERM